MKVVFFGDSLTWGGYGGDYVGTIRERVGERHTLINAGVGGNTAVNLERRLDADVLAHNPNAVFMMVGGNDAVSYSQPDTRPYYRKSMQLPNGFVSPDAFRTAYRQILSELQVNHIHTYVALPPIEANPAAVAAMRQYNAIAQAAAGAYNVPTLDLFAHFVPDAVPERRPISTRFIQQIGERERTGWSAWEAAQAEGGYHFSFDGVHWGPAVAATVAGLVIAFMGL